MIVDDCLYFVEHVPIRRTYEYQVINLPVPLFTY